MTVDPWQGVESFVAVAETGSFTRAAARMAKSVSQVSREVARLEARLGATLFVRTTRKVVVTEAGRQLESRFHRLIQEREAAFAAVRIAPGGMIGHLRMTCAVAYGERTVVPLVNRFLAANRGVTIEIVLTNTVLDLVGEGFDLAVRTGETADVRLQQRLLASRSLHLVASPAYLSAHGAPQTADDLNDHDCLTGSGDRWRFQRDGALVQLRPPTFWRCNSGFAVLDGALEGLGLAQLPDFYVRKDLEAGRLVELLVDSRPPDETIWAVSQRRSEPQARLAALIETIGLGLGDPPSP